MCVEVFEKYGLEVGYAGPYGILSENKKYVTNPIVPSYGKGHKNISIYEGVIGHSFTTWSSTYAPSILDLEAQDPNSHSECRTIKEGEEKKDMSEIVIIKKRKYPEIGTESSKKEFVVQECYDLDIKRPNVFSEEGASDLERLIAPTLDLIFPGPLLFTPERGTHLRALPNGCEKHMLART